MNTRHAVVVGLLASCTSPSSLPKPTPPSLCPAGTVMPMQLVHGSSYVVARAQYNERILDGTFLVDTGASSTVVDRPFANRLGVGAGECTFDGKLEIRGELMASSFGIRATTNACDAAFRNPGIAQNGIIGIDWISDRVMQFDYQARQLSTWRIDEWARCHAGMPQHQSIAFVAGPTDVSPTNAQPRPSCLFENAQARNSTFSGCSIPYVAMNVSLAGRKLTAPIQIDIGREQGVKGDVSVNRALRDALKGKGELRNERCIDADAVNGEPCHIYLYDVAPDTTIDIGLGTTRISSIEYRDEKHGEPYKNPMAAGLIGMDYLRKYPVLVFDPMHAQLHVLERGYSCSLPCSARDSR